jgi:hypothetical protein
LILIIRMSRENRNRSITRGDAPFPFFPAPEALRSRLGRRDQGSGPVPGWVQELRCTTQWLVRRDPWLRPGTPDGYRIEVRESWSLGYDSGISTITFRLSPSSCYHPSSQMRLGRPLSTTVLSTGRFPVCTMAVIMLPSGGGGYGAYGSASISG